MREEEGEKNLRVGREHGEGEETTQGLGIFKPVM